MRIEIHFLLAKSLIISRFPILRYRLGRGTGICPSEIIGSIGTGQIGSCLSCEIVTCECTNGILESSRITVKAKLIIIVTEPVS